MVDKVDRVEPTNTYLASCAHLHADPLKAEWIHTQDPTLATLPTTPLASAQLQPAQMPRKWIATIAASIVLHVAIAAWFLMGGFDQDVLVEGGQEIATVQLGDGDVNAVMSGAAADFDATSVTIIPITAPKPVEVSEAVPVETVEALEPVAEEVMQPVEEMAVLAETVESVAEAPADDAPPTPASETQQILATDVPQTVEDIETVQPVEEAEAKKPVTEQPKQPDADAKREDARRAAAEKERKAEADKRRAERSEERRKQAAAEQKRKADDARAKRAADAADRKAKQAKAAGQNGDSNANARKGSADGSDKAASGANKGKGKANAAGNAAVSNYPGKVRSRIARAAGKIPRSLKSKAKGDVVVSFTVTSSGGLGGVSIARSSGVAALDSAAIAAVRRAAPFPAIPDGRASWQFTIPMGLGR